MNFQNYLIDECFDNQPKTINNYVELAQQMAVYTKSVKYAIEEALKLEDETGELTKLKAVFNELLLLNLENNDFADIYAQTITYGLFTARFYHAQTHVDTFHKTSLKKTFNRQTASKYFTNKIPFLQGLFKPIIKSNITSKLDWAIDNLIEFFAKINLNNIFNQETKIQDPILYFYEIFLRAYEASLRKRRGVYYTPEPVVYFMVKAVNDIIAEDFNHLDGLGNPKVNILDPATGTGTFLYQVIKQLYNNFSQNNYHQKTYLFHEYLNNSNVIKRLFGYELLIIPYTIAHLNLQLLLDNLGYNFQENERLNIFLTNALDEILKNNNNLSEKHIFQESNISAKKQPETPILVVLGNPPYSGHSANKNSWIDLSDYYIIDGLKLDEKNPKWLQDDYVKFIRFGQWKIEQNQEGILAFITNHGYLDNPTFRGMRQNLMQTFERIFIINLHGNIKKKEMCPDGSKDENIFDIQQGVSILIALKRQFSKPFRRGIYYYDLWGKREVKYKFLQENDFHNIAWQEINPVSPFYLFTPQDDLLIEEYHNYWKITDIMPINSVGIVTARDSLTIHNTPEKVAETIKDFIALSEEEAREKYNLGKDSQDWKVSLAQKDIKNSGINKDLIMPILYRPFDLKYTYYTGQSGGFICRPRSEVMRNMLLGDNLGIAIGRSGKAIDQNEWNIVFCSNYITELNLYRRGGNNLFPLYIYPNKEKDQKNLLTEKQANFSPEFIKAITEKLGYTPTPETIFYYIYAILHSPAYRQRYQAFLKIDFPRIPLTSNQALFSQLASKGEELVNLHLLKTIPNFSLVNNEIIGKIIDDQGDSQSKITQINYNANQQRIYFNKDCYFTGISQPVWEFKIGGYQVLDKWLKDRKKANRNLSTDDIIHYQKIILVLTETLKIMTEIDEIIDFL